MKQKMKFLMGLMMTLFAWILCPANGVSMAAAGDLPDAGKTASGNPSEGDLGGVATETSGRETGDPEFYTKDIDKKITKIRPMATPIDQISRHATAQKADSFEVKYYSVGTRPIVCKTSAQFEAMVGVASQVLKVDDPGMFTLDDTIRVVGVKGITNSDGQPYEEGAEQDLVLCVCGQDNETNMPVVYAVNGTKDSKGAPILAPLISSGTTLVRMGKSCAELDVQTGEFNNLPTAEIQYCQNFMIQVEQSTFDKLAAKEVDWGFTDLEEDGIYDMRLTQENSFLFGVRQKIKHVSKKSGMQWFTGGIWWMAGKDIEVGTWNEAKGETDITDDDLVDISKDLFVGTGIGNKRKIMFCGSDMLCALSKIKSDKFRLKDNVEHWGLKFKSWDTDFGEILTIHHELFDMNGMSDCALALDPEYLKKKTHISWQRNILDLKKAGQRNTDAVVLQEVACLYLTYAKAHARMKLAKAAA